MKKTFLLWILFLLPSCAKDLIYSETAPSWVNTLRSGNSSLRVTSGDKILFRSNYKEAYKNRSEICTKAIEKNISFIKKAYPFSTQIPMTVELVFFDPTVNDCSTTISVSRQLMEKIESLVAMKDKYEKEKRKIKKETEKVSMDLKKANAEKEDLKKKVEHLNELLAENQGYAKQIKTIEDFIESAKNERRQIKQRVKNYIYTGMEAYEVDEVMKGYASVSGQVAYGDRKNPCSDGELYTRYKDYVICGVSVYYKQGFVTEVCNMNDFTCFSKKFQ